MHVVSKPTVSHYFQKKNLGFPDTHVMRGREQNKQMLSCIRNLNPRTRVNQDQEINPKTVPLGHEDKEERDSILQQYASPCGSGTLSISTTNVVPVDGLWPFAGSSSCASPSAGTAVRYMSHICSGRSSSSIFCLIIRLFSMFRRLYLNSMMVFVYLLSAVTAEPMQVPKEPHANLRRGLKTVLD